MAQTWYKTDTAADNSGNKCYSETIATNPFYTECALSDPSPSGSNTITMPAKQSYMVGAYESGVGMGVSSIPAGTWYVNINVTGAAASGSYFDRVDICEITPLGASVKTIGSWTGSVAIDATGNKQLPVTIGSPVSVTSTNHWYIQVSAFCNAHAGTSVSIDRSLTVVDTITAAGPTTVDCTKGAVVVSGLAATVSVASTVADIFNGDLETETSAFTTQFDSKTVAGSNTLTITTSAGEFKYGSQGAKVTYDGTEENAYATVALSDETEFYGRIFLKLNSDFSIGDVSSQLTILRIRDGATNLFNLSIQSENPATNIRWSHTWEGGSGVEWIYAGGSVSLNTWYCLEYHWKAGTGANGGLEVKLDGVTQGSDFTRDLSSYAADSLRAGSIDYSPGFNASVDSELYWDDVQVSSTDWLGTAELSSESTTVDCTTGAVVVAGNTTEVKADTTILCQSGSLTIASYAAAFSSDTFITCTKGAVVVAGNTTEVKADTTMLCQSGSLTIASYAAAFSSDTFITCTKGAVVVSGLAATVSVASPTTVSATAGAITVTGHAAAIPTEHKTYYMRADGTAANKAAATGPETTQSACMNLAIANNETYSPGDTIIVSDDGGVYRGELRARGGDSGADVSWVGSGSPVFNRSALITGWTEYGSDIWQAALTTEPRQIWVDETYGDRKTDTGELVGEYDWFWESNVLYLYAPGDPDSEYSSPGVEAQGAPVWYSAITPYGSYVTIDGLTGEKAEYGAFCYNYSHVTYKNCIFQWGWRAGCGTGSGSTHSDIVVEDCVVRYNSTGISFAGGTPSDCIARRNKVYENGKYQHAIPHWPGGYQDYTFGIKFWEDAYRCIIEENEVYSNGPSTPVDINIGNGIWLDYVTASSGNDNIIRHNVVYDNRACGIYIEGGGDYSNIYGNLVYDNAQTGNIGVWTPAGIRVDARSGSTSTYNLVYNNTVVGGRFGIICLTTDQSGGTALNYNEFRNNIVVDAIEQNLWADTGGDNDGSNGTGNVYNFNCFGAESSNFIRWNATNYSTYDTWLTASSQSDTNAEADPLLNNPGSDEYWLQPGSPCIDAGTNLGATYDDVLHQRSSWPSAVYTEDQDDWGSGWDIGAFAHVGVYQNAVGAITVAANDAAVGIGTTVNATKKSILLAAYNATLAGATGIDATKGAITISGHNATVTAGQSVNQTATGTVTITDYGADIIFDERIFANYGAILVQPRAPTIAADVAMVATKGAVTLAAYSATINLETTVTASIGAVSVSALATTIVFDAKVLASSDAVTVTGYATTVQEASAISCTKGAVTVSGHGATVNGVINVYATTGTITATGNAANVASIVNATAGAVTASANNATVNAAAGILATAGAVTVAGYGANVQESSAISCTRGAVTLAAYAAAVNGVVNVYTTSGAVTVSGYSATVGAGSGINATFGAITLASYRAELTANVEISTTYDAITLAGRAASVSSGNDIAATRGIVTITGYDSAIGAPVGVSATTGSITIAGYATSVSAGINIAATTAAVTIAGYGASIAADTGIDATIGTVTVSGHNAKLSADVVVSTSKGAVTLAGNAGTVNAELVVSAPTGSVTTTSYAATIVFDATVNATTGTTTITGYVTHITSAQPTDVLVTLGAINITPISPAISLMAYVRNPYVVSATPHRKIVSATIGRTIEEAA